MSMTEFGVQPGRKFERPLKRPKANWTQAFPAQQAALHPERGPAGGVKARSASESVRMAVYNPIAEMYKRLRPRCECCRLVFKRAPEAAEHVHHVRGRDGLLLFDVRWFKSACAECHRWVDQNKGEARSLGLLAEAGDWRRQ